MKEDLGSYFPLVWRAAAAAARKGLDWSEAVSAGMLGLAEAAARYDPAAGAWEAYAKRRVEGAVLDAVRSSVKRARREEVVDLGGAPWRSEVAPDEEAERRALVAQVAEAVAGLPREEQLVLALRYVEDLSWEAAGRVMSLSRGRVRAVHDRAIRRLREALGIAAT